MHPRVFWPFPLRGLRRTKLKPSTGFVCSTHMKEPKHGSPAPPRCKPSHLWRRLILSHLPPHRTSKERSRGQSHSPSSASTSYGPWQRKPCCLSEVALLPLWIMTARETPAALSMGAEVSLSNNSKILAQVPFAEDKIHGKFLFAWVKPQGAPQIIFKELQKF